MTKIYTHKILSTSSWFVLMMIFWSPVNAQDKEYLMKAGFIERFTQFVDWPVDSSCTDTTAPFRVTVLGKNPFGTYLEDYFSGKIIDSRQVEVHYVDSFAKISGTQMLFITKENQRDLDTILRVVNGCSILTISDCEGCAQAGVAINFIIVQDKVRFEINLTALEKTDIILSSQILKVAALVIKEDM